MPSRNKAMAGSAIAQNSNVVSDTDQVPTFLERTLNSVEDVQQELAQFNKRLERLISRAIPVGASGGVDGASNDLPAMDPPLTIRIDDTLVEVKQQLDIMNSNVSTLESII